jgi:hypothetical protein
MSDAVGRPAVSRSKTGLVAGFLGILAASTFLMTADVRPAQAQFGISIGGGGFGGGGGFRNRGSRMEGPARGSIQRMPGERGGRFMDGGGRGGRILEGGGRSGRFTEGGGRGGRFIDEGGRGGRFGDGPMRGDRFGDRPGRGGRIRDDAGYGNGRPGREADRGRYGDDVGRTDGRPGRRPPWGRPGVRPGSDDVVTRPPRRPPGDRPPGRPPGGRPPIIYPGDGPVVRLPPGRRPPVIYPDDGPVVLVPPGGGGIRPPGGRPPGGRPPGGPPPRGPGFGPAAGAAAAAFGAPALISAARAGTDRQDVAGLPPANERRYVPDEVLFIMNANAPANAVRNVVRRFNLTLIAEEQSQLVGTVVHRYRIPSRTTVPAAIRAMTRTAGVGYVQPNYLFERPNYVFRLQSAATTQTGGASMQYVVDQLRLPEAHGLARGEQVPIAVIDSGVEATHPEMTGRIASSFDAVGGAFQAHEHGTGMAGAIVAHGQLTGVSPRANILAARAFAPGQSSGASGTSFHILRAMDWSISAGARVINMSFAGPRDPMMTRAIQVAAGRRIAMVAAMGNEGPGAPVSFPAADPNVIAVTATDQAGRLFAAASRGNHVAVAAPGVEIILPAPRGGYQISSGTSVAAAHVSGIAALLLERQPGLDPAQLRQILQETARRGATADPLLGAGLADPVPALTAARPPADAGVPMVTAPPPAPPAATAEAPPATVPGAASAEAPAVAPPRQATVAPGTAEASD